MIPLQPFSVKFTKEEWANLKALAIALGWSEGHIIRDSVAAVSQLAQKPNCKPKIVGMLRYALQHEKKVSSTDNS